MYPFKDEVVIIDHVQFAADGNWEDVQIVRRNDPTELDDLSDWLGQAADDVAAEVLFLNEHHEISGFFGVRQQSLSGKDRTRSWLNFTEKALSASKIYFKDLVKNTLPTLGFPSHIPKSELTFEMGIFNFWKSAEPMLLGTTPLATIEDMCQKNSAPVWFSEGHDAPICLEYVWYDPAHIWVSQIVSDKVDNKHHVDMKKVKNLLQK